MRRSAGVLLVAALLAGAIHLDWHFARSTHHGGLSFGWRAHWILALPAFALTAWYVHRAWGGDRRRASVVVIGLATLLAQVLVPLAELLTGATLDWAFGPERWRAFAVYVGVGIATYVVVLEALGRRGRSAP